MTTTVDTLSIRKLKDNYGAEILGVDLAAADDDLLQQVVDTFHLHGAVLIRGQEMSPGAMVRFAQAFGQPAPHTIVEHTLPDHPEVYVLTNKHVATGGKDKGSHFDGVGWHTDYSYKAEPVMCTMLYAVQVPPEGADTMLSDMCAAYDTLPAERKQQLDKLVVHHSYQYFMATREFGRRELTEQQKADNPDVYHPIIRTHPANGRKALWPSSGTVRGIVGMDQAEALALIDEMVKYGTQEQFVYRHKWQVGDVLVWDNRCSLHTGSKFDDQKYIREMYRLWVKGDKPY